MNKKLMKEIIIIGGISAILVGGVAIGIFKLKNSAKDVINSTGVIEEVDKKNTDDSKHVVDNTKVSKDNNDSGDRTVLKFDLSNSIQTIYEGTVDVGITEVTYNNNTLTINAVINNNSGESINGHVSDFYIKDADDNVTKLDFFTNPTFNIDAPSGGKTQFKMVYKNIELNGDKLIVGGEFFRLGYFGDDKVINLEIGY